MALNVIDDVAEAESGRACSGWYRWFNADTERWWAARTTVPADPRLEAMIVSSSTYDGLRVAEENASIRPVKT
ncbi:hypothetical protein [Actinomadura sp. DC4]|uniref:hypothetical protein n=1 Tax=Actinomadura sp. DC4 TaxID=3055069 RepID=UPI0025AFFAB7|nr:hypothetical protein [Actinomadura sp. DC4]MDN3356104.1 hypothetical protein [Actinomadura sp. DC4]